MMMMAKSMALQRGIKRYQTARTMGVVLRVAPFPQLRCLTVKKGVHPKSNSETPSYCHYFHIDITHQCHSSCLKTHLCQQRHSSHSCRWRPQLNLGSKCLVAPVDGNEPPGNNPNTLDNSDRVDAELYFMSDAPKSYWDAMDHPNVDNWVMSRTVHSHRSRDIPQPRTDVPTLLYIVVWIVFVYSSVWIRVVITLKTYPEHSGHWWLREQPVGWVRFQGRPILESTSVTGDSNHGRI